jgi:NAD(P)-dependent dehydrogenase (short-subunit alcohol dehydrogenase family)
VQVAERTGNVLDHVLAEWANAIAFGRLIEPAEVAQACAWLVSPESSGISGQSIVVDGPPPAA